MAGSTFGGQAGGAGQAGSKVVLPTIPTLPPDVVKAFPSLKKYDEDMKRFFENLVVSVRKGN